eukprot:14866-Heterococcus_DN1.PRE.4
MTSAAAATCQHASEAAAIPCSSTHCTIARYYLRKLSPARRNNDSLSALQANALQAADKYSASLRGAAGIPLSITVFTELPE